MGKYPISKDFFPFSHFAPPISEKFLAIAVPNMKTPKFIYKDDSLNVKRYEIKSYDGENIECFFISPKAVKDNAPCLIYIHGGGFVLSAAGYHYKNAMRYAKEVGCRVLFVNYRLAPKNPHPVFFEDCYAAMCWAYDNAESLGIDKERIGIGGERKGDLANYVLGGFKGDDKTKIEEAIVKAADACKCFIEYDLNKAMVEYNTKKPKPEKKKKENPEEANGGNENEKSGLEGPDRTEA